jgi:DNA polymerase IV
LTDRWILHMDLDAMYASVEALLDPSLRGKPVIVGARPGTRGVVSTCSYEARAFGVRSAMPIGEAYARCPQGVFLPVRMEAYRDFSRRVLAILSVHVEAVQPLSIDEAFADLSGIPEPEHLAREIKDHIREEVGLVASMGLAGNKLVAKIATDRGKPDGFVVVTRGDEARFLAPLSVRQLWGVGPKTASRLEGAGISTIGELAAAEIGRLSELLGSNGARDLRERALGRDDSPVETSREIKSISDEVTFQRDEIDRRALWEVLRAQAQICAERLQREGLLARTVTIKLRYSDFTTVTRATTLDMAIDDAEEVARVSGSLMRRYWSADPRPLRLLGVRVSGFEETAGWRQLRLFP